MTTPSQTAVVPGSLGTTSLFVDYIYLDTDERRRFAQVSHEYLIEQLQFTGDESTSSVSNKIKLNFNHPVKELVWVVQPDAHVDLSSTAAYGGRQWFNFSDDFDPTYEHSSTNAAFNDSTAPLVGTGDLNAGAMPGVAAGGAVNVFVPVSFENGSNPVALAKLQLNGHDRFSERDGRYFNLVQPYQHHENVPKAGINVYSFGLKPEEHQPSGTCNMSRIDNATLHLTLTSQAVTGNRSCKVRVYAVNYNVLRIMSGWYIQACKSHIRKKNMASGLKEFKLQNRLLFGNTLKPLTPSWYFKYQWLRKTNSGMGKVEWINCKIHNLMGNPHAFGRQRLNSDWWDIYIPLKVQSSLQRKLIGNTDGWSCLLQLEWQHQFILFRFFLLLNISYVFSYMIFSLLIF